jgi:hypothetical protein
VRDRGDVPEFRGTHADDWKAISGAGRLFSHAPQSQSLDQLIPDVHLSARGAVDLEQMGTSGPERGRYGKHALNGHGLQRDGAARKRSNPE